MIRHNPHDIASQLSFDGQLSIKKFVKMVLSRKFLMKFRQYFDGVRQNNPSQS